MSHTAGIGHAKISRELPCLRRRMGVAYCPDGEGGSSSGV